MPEDNRPEGYLVVADISGYAAFLTGTELEQAHAMMIAAPSRRARV